MNAVRTFGRSAFTESSRAHEGRCGPLETPGSPVHVFFSSAVYCERMGNIREFTTVACRFDDVPAPALRAF